MIGLDIYRCHRKIFFPNFTNSSDINSLCYLLVKNVYKTLETLRKLGKNYRLFYIKFESSKKNLATIFYLDKKLF